MIVYSEDKQQFLSDVKNNVIDRKVKAQFLRKYNRRSVAESEFQSWRNSLVYMGLLLNDHEIPSNSGVAIEFEIHNTSKRIDFILTGLNEHKNPTAVIVELKQWTQIEPLESVEEIIAISPESEVTKVRAPFRGRLQETVHPSYQAYSYRTLLSDFNKNVTEIPIELLSCAYLHNYEPEKKEDPLLAPYFSDYIDEAPLFYRNDVQKLSDFIKRYIRYGDSKQTLVSIENGEIRPSKSLQDSLVAMLNGQREFLLIDEQKVAFEKILSFSKKSQKDGKKRVCIIYGGPGTGKSVVAINLLVRLIGLNQMCAYVTKNRAPRSVFETKLREGNFKKKNISALFKSSGSFISAQPNDFGTLIVDEAHRLQQLSSMGFRGEDQIKEIMNASRCSVFFIDEQQRVTAKDYGSVKIIKEWASHFNAEVMEEKLLSQFRCGGSDGYLSWLDWILGLSSDSAHKTLEHVTYDFKVFDSPTLLREEIIQKNQVDNKSRLVAGYCWDWISKTESNSQPDIVIDDFEMYWNLLSDETYAITASSIDQIGCIHTTQGLEFNYVGVIIGDDLVYRDGEVQTDYKKRAKTDRSLHGLKGKADRGDKEAQKEIDLIIRNTYRTLMSRGMKGCYLYCTDKNLAAYLKQRIGGYPIEEASYIHAAETPFL